MEAIQSRIQEEGLETTENWICEEYTDEEIDNDINSIDFEMAFELVEKLEKEKQAHEMEEIARIEREKA